MNNQGHKFGFRTTRFWLFRTKTAARLAGLDTSDLARIAIDEKIDRLKQEKPGFASALAERLQEAFPEQTEQSVDFQSLDLSV